MASSVEYRVGLSQLWSELVKQQDGTEYADDEVGMGKVPLIKMANPMSHSNA